jgi:hypothetical protein
MTKYALAILLLLASSLPASAASAVSFFGHTLSPLLYVTSAESGDGGATFTKRQVYIFRDGTVLVADYGESYQSELARGASVRSGTASRARMMELTAALTKARVGYQQDCLIDPPDAPLEWYFEFRWFGAGSRTNRFKASQDVQGSRCPDEIEGLGGLIDAVHLVLNSVSATTSLHTP